MTTDDPGTPPESFPQPSFPPGPSLQPPANRGRRKTNVLLLSIIGALVIVIAVMAVVLSGSGKKGPSSSASNPPAQVAASTPALNSTDQQFVSDMQSQFSFGSSVADTDIATYGEQVCSDRQTGQSQSAEITMTEGQWTNTPAGQADAMVRLAEQDICPTYLPTETVTYKVFGTAPSGYISPSVQYGPDGSNFNGSVPMDVTASIPSSPPSYYAISVQLSDAGGHVTCQLVVDGMVISQSSARGASNIADCQIGQDSTGSWINENNG